MNIKTALLSTVAPVAFDNPAPSGAYNPTPADVSAARMATTRNAANTDEMMQRSADSAAMVEYWDLTDTLVDGITALRLAGETYLPKFPKEEKTEYEFRLSLTKFTNVYRDIIEGLAAKPFEQEVTLVEDENKKSPTELTDLLENIDGAGNNITVFSAATFFNGINSAIDWIFVDYPKTDNRVRTVAEVKSAGIRPYWSHVLGRNILKAETEVINGNELLRYIKIYEPGSPDHIREFEREAGGLIVWRLYVKSDVISPDGKTQFVLEDQGALSIDVIPLVPFITARRDGRTFKLFPAMRDAADLARDLYQQESGLKWTKTLTAYPMLAANGIKPQMEADGKTVKKIAVGPSRVLYSVPDGNGNSGSWAYVEPSAQSLTFLAADIEATIKELRELGRQPLTAQSGNLTVITTAVAANKAKSSVKAWALVLKDALENALVITCKFMGISTDTYDPTVYVYTEFDEFIDGKDLETLDADRDRGDISRETLLEEKKRRGVYGSEFTIDRENERLLAEVPSEGVDNNPDDNPPPNGA